VRLTDELTGQSLDLAARVVINAAGVWAADVDSSIRLRPSRGTNLVFDAETFGNPTAALTIPIPGETNRFIFALPVQLGRIYLGLTDEEAPGPIPDVPEPTPGEVTFLLDTVNTALQTALTPADITGMYAGLRPLIDAGEGRTADLSRDHAVLESDSGLFSVVGGKLTEYRFMAEDVLDRAIAARGISTGPCRTHNLPLVGAPANPVATQRNSGILRTSGELPGSLVARYGAESRNVIATARCERPAEPVAEGIDVTRAEFEFAVTHEGALDVGDILDRRTRIGLVAADRERAMDAAMEFLAATR
jgi:glycerol-3-phosphate dehydrogenase